MNKPILYEYFQIININIFINYLSISRNHLTIAAEWKNPVDTFMIYFVDKGWINCGVFISLTCKLPNWLYILNPQA